MRRSFSRKTGFRDSKLIVIATEGEVTEHQYFNGLKLHKDYKSPRLHIEILKRGTGNSDPKACLNELNEFKKEYHLTRDDELWLVCDVDRWGDRKLAEVGRLCRQKKYLFAVSNPCFEAWLLLHKVTYNQYSQSEKDDLNGECGNIERELRRVLGTYNKTNIDVDNFLVDLENAITEARLIDVPEHQWPHSLGSKLFLLVESIVKMTGLLS